MASGNSGAGVDRCTRRRAVAVGLATRRCIGDNGEEERAGGMGMNAMVVIALAAAALILFLLWAARS